MSKKLGNDIVALREAPKVLYSGVMPSAPVTLIEPGDADDPDNSGSPVTRPDLLDQDRIAHCRGIGTLLRLALVYDRATVTVVQQFATACFGRFGNDGRWRRLLSNTGTPTILHEPDVAIDADDGTTYKIHHLPHTTGYPLDGCDQIILGVRLDLITTGGDDSLAYLVGWIT